MRRPTIAIVGPGRVGTALARQLARAGYKIAEIVSRNRRSSLQTARRIAQATGANASKISYASLGASIVWFCVPDCEISNAAAELSRLNWKGKVVFHCSGVVTSDALRILRQRGAAVASVHPLMTFAASTTPKLQGSTFAVEGDKLAVNEAEKIVRALGGQVLHLRKPEKPAYHAFATMICPMLVSLLAAAEKYAITKGMPKSSVRRGIMPIVAQTLRNYAELGPAVSFTGPMARGDVETVKQHLRAFGSVPEARQVYISLARVALKSLPSRNRNIVRRLLDEFSSEKIRRNVKRTNRGSKRSVGQK